jgi:hypothetical protein
MLKYISKCHKNNQNMSKREKYITNLNMQKCIKIYQKTSKFVVKIYLIYMFVNLFILYFIILLIFFFIILLFYLFIIFLFIIFLFY